MHVILPGKTGAGWSNEAIRALGRSECTGKAGWRVKKLNDL